MAFPRSGAADQRRRRALIEENFHPSGERDPESESGLQERPAPLRMPGRRYTEAASADRQPPMTAVIPQRAWTLLVLMLGGLCAIAAVEAIYGQAGLQPRGSWARSIAAGDVAHPGGLASWLSSIMLLTAGFQGIQVYRLRRHRTDDYRGRYGVWLWVSPALIIASLAIGTHLYHDLLAVGGQWLCLGGDWQLPLLHTAGPLALWLLMAMRLVFEIRESRLAVAGLVAATIAYSASVGVQLLVPDRPLSLTVPMLSSSLLMLGHLAVFLAVAAYGRHVYLDAQGWLGGAEAVPEPAKRAKRKRAEAAAAQTDLPAVISMAQARAQETAAADPQAVKPVRGGSAATTGADGKSPKAEATAEQDASPDDQESPSDAEDGSAESRISRAERRRLRKQENRGARKAA